MSTQMVEVEGAQLSQPMRALQRANEVRLAQAALRREVFEERTSMADLLRDPPELILKLAIGDLLLWVPGIGKARMKHCFDGVIIAASQPVWRIGQATREKIAANVERHTPNYENRPARRAA